MNDHEFEQRLQAKGLTAPRVSPADIEANIIGECYFTAEQGRAAAVAMSADGFRRVTVQTRWTC